MSHVLRDYVLLLSILLLNASCGPVTKKPSTVIDEDGNLLSGYSYAEVTLLNQDKKQDVQLYWKSWAPGRSLGEREELIQNESRIVPAGATMPLPSKEVIVAQNGRLEVSYRSGNTLVDLESITIPAANVSLKRQFSIPTVDGFDEQSATTKLEDLAKNPVANLSKQGDGRFIESVTKDLGSLLFLEGNTIIDRVHLQDVSLSLPNPLNQLSGSTVVTASVMANLTVDVPIYANIESSMSHSQFHNLIWDIRYFSIDSTFSPSGVLMSATKEQLEQLNAVFELHPNASVKFISGGTAIKSARFSIAQGTQFDTKADVSVLSMITGGVAYAFLQKDEKMSSFSDLVTDIELSEAADSKALASWVKQQLKKRDKKNDVPVSQDKSLKTIHIAPSRLTETIE